MSLRVPGRTELRRDIVGVARDLRTKLETVLASDCQDYSLTTDIWTDRRQRSFMAVTIHYLNENFQMANWTLEVEALGIYHLQCVAHALHLVVAGALIRKK
eukprot:jgi/Phyca11/72778/gw1.3.504.1